jgi:hypothetical protein
MTRKRSAPPAGLSLSQCHEKFVNTSALNGSGFVAPRVPGSLPTLQTRVAVTRLIIS